MSKSGSSSQCGISTGLRDITTRWTKTGYRSRSLVCTTSRRASGLTRLSVHRKAETVWWFFSHSE
jgi:hypothetical protein